MSEIAFAVLASTALLLGLLAVMGALLVVNANRRQRYRAEMAELQLLQRQTVMQAEREAQQQTLRDVGRELHDNLGQLLTLAQMGMDSLMAGPANDPRMEEVLHAVELAIDEVRRMGRSLSSDMWVDRSFSEALGGECERIERAGLARMHLLVEEEPPRLMPDAKTILYRVFQEVVNNALKHAQADTIEVALLQGQTFRFSIADNGRGFDPAKITAGTGLVNIRRRCDLIGFKAELASVAGEGTRWLFTQQTDPHAT